MAEIGGPGPEVAGVSPSISAVPEAEISPSALSALEEKVDTARQGAKKSMPVETGDPPVNTESSVENPPQQPEAEAASEVENRVKTENEIPPEQRGDYHRTLGRLAEEKRANGEPIDWEALTNEAKQTLLEQANDLNENENQRLDRLENQIKELRMENEELKKAFLKTVEFLAEQDPKKRESLLKQLLKITTTLMGVAVMNTAKTLNPLSGTGE
ncbi:hypothetical protein KKG52_00800 [Patescibacteria group bacterium]|nr:hypothetical protein [Patescibacteria group bacterium]